MCIQLEGRLQAEDVIYKTNTCSFCIHNIIISIPPACFGDYIVIIREYKTLRYLKHIKI